MASSKWAAADGADFAAALFGILKVGAVVVMVNPSLSRAEVDAFFEYSRAAVAIVDPDQASSFEGPHRTLAFPGPEVEQLSPHWENTITHRDDPAMWIFSGGTTGRPKAAVQSHRSFANSTHCYARTFMGYTSADRTLAVPKLYFGYATGSNLLFPFSVGATACLFREHPTPEVLFRQIARHRPTILINVPKMVHAMASHPEASSQDLSCLKVVTSAGEALPPSLYELWTRTFKVELIDGLGTAEMWHIFLSNRPGEVRPGTLGRAVPGFTIKVADDEGREVEPGEVGRLWVRGDSRALCYWQLMEQSHEAFRGPWFASGDLVRADADGFITYCGRGDDMLKVGGKWLAPLEVESCLLTHQAVKECAVVGVADDAGLTRPVAYVLAAGGSDELAEELKEHVLARLDAYKHPRQIIFVEEMPRTHLGKIDRGKLRAL